MSNLTIILKALDGHPFLKCLSVSQLLGFLTQASALKRHIILAQPAGEPMGSAPLILPSLIREFLANTTGIALQAVQDAWDVLKDDVWAMSPLTDCVAFPPTDCCENPKCDRTTELKREDARQVLAYTINGAQPAYSIHLTCDSMCTPLASANVH
jgi:hypothetical protein